MTGKTAPGDTQAISREDSRSEEAQLIREVATALLDGRYHSRSGHQMGTIALSGNRPVEYAEAVFRAADGGDISVIAARLGSEEHSWLALFVAPVGEKISGCCPACCYRNPQVEAYSVNCDSFGRNLRHIAATQNK